MKFLLFKSPFIQYFLICSFSVFTSFSALSATVKSDSDSNIAELSFERLSNALRELNFSTSFVVVKNNQAEPYHWLHGNTKNTASGNQVELEILALLNGPRRDILRIDNIVSYIEPEYAPYSITSSHISGPIPAVFGQDISVLKNNYHFVSVGKSRVLGRIAQLIRIVPKDTHRFGYWVWLDQQSGLLLKLAIITRKGQLLEQIQFTHLEITDNLSEHLKQLQATDLPKIIDTSTKQEETELAWQVNWLPSGFKKIKSNIHRINTSKQAVEFMLFNDGLVDISVYVNPSKDKQRAIEFANDGATLVLNKVINNVEVSVVGKIPVASANQIVNSVRFIPNHGTP
ncbi:MucB/RseB C-terminal domain-containing protein [Candidatus Colwellia aromaticivorans]|uniref:MucB/RseB C-terminal domain-containing protein n=1 Tax=Candidatus Colwellia aromaticivorans TaxID=2267621 RepID=UPI000DF33471|nr:MucB/RseB C-terminal domain-containing protein [Candidatus Colwellia aromaticivorans]